MTATDAHGGFEPTRGGRDLGWLLVNFTQQTVGVTETVAVSADGFLLASSAGQERDGIEQFAAIVSGLNSLTRGAAGLYRSGRVRQVIVEMDERYLFIMSINDGSTIGALASKEADIGSVGYELALLINRVGSVLTPALIDELKNSVSTRMNARTEMPR